MNTVWAWSAIGMSAILHFLHIRARTIPAPLEHTMSDTQPTHTSNIFDTVQQYADAVFNEILKITQTVNGDYAAAKQNPLFGSILSIGTSLAHAELARFGIPVDAQTNIAAGIAGVIDALAAMHPAIVTP